MGNSITTKCLMAGLLAAITAGTPLLASAAGEASYQAANEAANDHEYGKALALYEQAAAEGNVAAQRSAGYMRLAGQALYGPGVDMNHSAAARWFSLAAANGCGISKRMLSRLHRLAPDKA